MTTLATAPKALQPDADGFIRLDRPSCYAQILLHLSADDEQPTKFETLDRLIPFAKQSIRDSLLTLCAHGFARRVRPGYYVRLYGHIPGVSA